MDNLDEGEHSHEEADTEDHQVLQGEVDTILEESLSELGPVLPPEAGQVLLVVDVVEEGEKAEEGESEPQLHEDVGGEGEPRLVAA